MQNKKTNLTLFSQIEAQGQVYNKKSARLARYAFLTGEYSYQKQFDKQRIQLISSSGYSPSIRVSVLFRAVMNCNWGYKLSIPRFLLCAFHRWLDVRFIPALRAWKDVWDYVFNGIVELGSGQDSWLDKGYPTV